MIVRQLKLKLNAKQEQQLSQSYKGNVCGRDVIPINSRFSTKTCSNCLSLTGPTGWDGLKVRQWQCPVCGAVHDRDINSAMVAVVAGGGVPLKEVSNVLN